MTTILPDVSIEHCAQHVHIAFQTPLRVTSSAVLNGGVVYADHLVNLKVHKDNICSELPSETLAKYATKCGWAGTTVGMMTAASMNSFRMAKHSEQGVDIVVLVTAGLGNARRIGDCAEYRYIADPAATLGTINIVVLTSAQLSAAASIEAVLMVTEAKAAALQDAGIKSAISNSIATGTGTDSVAIVSGNGAPCVSYCGKHVLFGEILGRSVRATLADSIAWNLSYGTAANL
ncbi:MAG: adenosylcobinamide amidohydrolase [Desulfuromonas sp.]|nr:adenosylcobinamide amidohydrolase [Desulfuromonas sp.]